MTATFSTQADAIDEFELIGNFRPCPPKTTVAPPACRSHVRIRGYAPHWQNYYDKWGRRGTVGNFIDEFAKNNFLTLVLTME